MAFLRAMRTRCLHRGTNSDIQPLTAAGRLEHGMNYSFVKMQSAGNDYIYLDCMEGMPENPGAMARTLSRRRFSVGSDGLVLICPSRRADAGMRMFNADGSEGSMCGNAVRCVGKYLYDSGKVLKTSITVETESGIRQLWLSPGSLRARPVSADMGFASFRPEDIPAASEASLIDKSIIAAGKPLRITALSVGNPHAVIFSEDSRDPDPTSLGPILERHSLFPDRTNVEFVRIPASGTLAVRVWERGSGETMACGTGACAAAAAAVRTGRMPPSLPITVRMPGGELAVLCKPDFRLTLSGVCETVYRGEVSYPE